MDAKSLAKSKRAHSQHLSRNNKTHHPPNRNSKPVGTDKPPVKEKPKPSASSLPSNWDRYHDDSMTDNPTNSNTGVLPKSKGADYAYLLSEANNTTLFPSLDDFLSDFGHSYFAVRGETLLSSIQNDTFFVDNNTPPANVQASFLSLNLQALSEQLAKIDLPKRLFMEADLFPLDQYSEEGQNLSQDHNNASRHELQANTSSTSLKQQIQSSYPKTVSKPNENQLKLESETADAELDILLDSFADANLKEKVLPEKTVAFDIDSTLDDLLNETSTASLLDQKPSHEVKSIPVASKSEPLDDFDSWLDTI